MQTALELLVYPQKMKKELTNAMTLYSSQIFYIVILPKFTHFVHVFVYLCASMYMLYLMHVKSIIMELSVYFYVITFDYFGCLPSRKSDYVFCGPSSR